MNRPSLLLLSGLMALACIRMARAAEDPKSVLVIYRSNSDDDNHNGIGDSEEVARYYALRRGIPADHLLGVKVQFAGDISLSNKYLAWPLDAFQKRMVKPVTDKLDQLGRKSIRTIVVGYGLPVQVTTTPNVRVSADLALGCPFKFDEKGPHMRDFYDANPRYAAPHFEKVRETEQLASPDDIGYIVGRIDGLNVLACESMIDGAMYADTYNVDGYAYIDTRYGEYTDDVLAAWKKAPDYYSYADVDKSIALTRLLLDGTKVKTKLQVDDGVIGDDRLKFTDGTPAATAKRALLYAGWYNYGQYRNVWDWLPGSVAVDFDSISLFAPHTLFASFGGMALFSGVNATVGVFTEPGATGHPMPDVLMWYYSHGYSFGEAAWLAVPFKPYFCVAIGDPLMNPFGHARKDDTSMDLPDVLLSRDGTTLSAHIMTKGENKISRARLVVSPKENDTLLTPATWHDGRYQREHTLSATIQPGAPGFAGVVVTDPAGNTARLWLPVPEK